ncbi:aromatic acid exporter family protein [Mariniluteicoccus endophyticus]
MDSRRIADLLWPGHPRTWAEVPYRIAPVLLHALRLSFGAVVAYLLTMPLMSPGVVDLTGCLTALLVLQASTQATFKMAAVRVGAVLTGVAVALVVTSHVGLSWWSLGVVVGAALLLARIFRLGEQALETPISAMLILATAGQEIAVETRVVTTLVGAAVGVVMGVALPPVVPVRHAAHAVRRVSDRLGGCLRQASVDVADGPVTRERVAVWLARTRETHEALLAASTRVSDVGEARRWNPRAIGTADLEPVLRSGTAVLEQTLFAVRTLFATIEREAPASDDADDPFGEEARQAFAVVLDDLADAAEAFGRLVQAEAHGTDDQVRDQLGETLEVLRETRVRLTELMFVDARDQPGLWLLRGTVLDSIEQVLRHLDLDAHLDSQREWATREAGRRLSSGQLVNRDTLAALRRRQRPRPAPRVRPPGTRADGGPPP